MSSLSQSLSVLKPVRLVVQDVGYGAPIHPVLIGKCLLRNPASGVAFSNLLGLQEAQLAVFPAASDNRIPEIVFLCPYIQMLGSNAWRVVTSVKHELARRQLDPLRHEHQTVNPDISPLKPDFPVAMLIKATLVFPAPVWQLDDPFSLNIGGKLWERQAHWRPWLQRAQRLVLLDLLAMPVAVARHFASQTQGRLRTFGVDTGRTGCGRVGHGQTPLQFDLETRGGWRAAPCSRFLFYHFPCPNDSFQAEMGGAT